METNATRHKNTDTDTRSLEKADCSPGASARLMGGTHLHGRVVLSHAPACSTRGVVREAHNQAASTKAERTTKTPPLPPPQWAMPTRHGPGQG